MMSEAEKRMFLTTANVLNLGDPKHIQQAGADLLEQAHANWSAGPEVFAESRVANAEALQELAVEDDEALTAALEVKAKQKAGKSKKKTKKQFDESTKKKEFDEKVESGEYVLFEVGDEEEDNENRRGYRNDDDDDDN
jgi:hypothetical protein